MLAAMNVSDPNPSHGHIRGSSGLPLIFLCDHASNAIPEEYGRLGLPRSELERHIAYDIGAHDLTLCLANHFRTDAFFTRFSRLLIDPNRGLDDPTLIMRISDGAAVPGNAGVDAVEREKRISRFYMPYHDAIRAELDARTVQGQTPALISIHSFTPVWRGTERPWHAGILWDSDGRLARPLIAELERQPGIVVGDNEPYHGALEGDTLNQHGTRRGLPHVLIEIRQDLISGKSGVDEWCARLVRALEPIMKGVGLPAEG